MNPSDGPAKVMDQAEWSKVVDAANKEGEVVVYGVLNPSTVELLPAAFQKAYPNIKLTYVRLVPADLTARVDAELASGNAGADVIDTLDNPTFDGYAAKGALIPLAVPALGDSQIDRETVQRTPYVATYGDTAWGWAWNTKLLPKGINSWQDFLSLDPALVGITDPAIGPSVAVLTESFESPQAGGPGYLEKLAAKGKPRIYAGSNPQIAALSAGEVIASLPVPGGNVEAIKATGAPIDYKFSPGSLYISNKGGGSEGGQASERSPGLHELDARQRGPGSVRQGGFLPVREGVAAVVKTNGAHLTEMKQITSEQFKAFQVRWNQLLNKK